MLDAGVGHRIADLSWSAYQHHFAGNAARAERTAADIDFNSPLMRLAARGIAPPTSSTEQLDEGAQDARSVESPPHLSVAEAPLSKR
jgi:hypothetical protein